MKRNLKRSCQVIHFILVPLYFNVFSGQIHRNFRGSYFVDQ